MENYNNLTELRRAKQSTEVEALYQPMCGSSSHPGVHPPYGDSSNFPSNPIGGSNAYEPPITRSPSPTSSASKSENEDSNSDDGADDSANSTKSKDQNDQDGAGPMGDTSNAEGLTSRFSFQPRSSYNDASDPSMHRESNLLLQMVPYRPRLPNPIRSDRLIPGGQGSDSHTKSATQEATNSVRLLLDKWTTSGSAPVSNILDEEAAREKQEASVGGPPFVLELADISSSVSWPISVELQALNSMPTEGRHRQEPNLMKTILVPHITQDCTNILHVFKIIICHHLRHGIIHSHNTDIPFTELLVLARRISGGHLIPFLNHQMDNLGVKFWPHYALRGAAFIIQKATNSSKHIMLISILSTHAHSCPRTLFHTMNGSL
jgi:hypothetical protein